MIRDTTTGKELSAMPARRKTLPWKRFVIIGLGVFAALVGASYLVYTALGSGRLNPLAMLALAAAISVLLPMVRANVFPSKRDRAAEFAFHEKRLEKEILDRLQAGLEPDAFGRIFEAPGRYHAAAGETLGRLTAEERVRSDPGLQVALLVTLARFHEKKGDPQSAIPLLETAIALQPHQFVVRMHLAGTYEWIGSLKDACRHYRWLRDHAGDLSKAMRTLVADKLNDCRAD